jgi:hypothetical protein
MFASSSRQNTQTLPEIKSIGLPFAANGPPITGLSSPQIHKDHEE